MRFFELYKFKDSSFTNFIYCCVDKEITIERFPNKVQYFYSWKCTDYNLIIQNCHKFVEHAVKVLGAYREQGHRCHTFDKTCIPHHILEKLEDNEDDIQSTLGKIPILGFF